MNQRTHKAESAVAVEGELAVPGGRVWYRCLGQGPGAPLLCLHGGPGFPHDYLEALSDLSHDRQVIFYDQLGCGRSERPTDSSLWVLERFVEELAAVQAALGLESFHLFGSSWGGMLSLQYALDRRPPILSLVLSNTPGSMRRFVADNLVLRRALPADVRAVMEWHEDRGFTTCPEYQGAIAYWFSRHVCRMRPWPVGLERAFAGFGTSCYETMVGPSEFFVTGNLRDWEILTRISEISVPTLFIAGSYDEVRPDHIAEMHAKVNGSTFVVFEESAHMPFEEERDAFMRVVEAFLQDAERSVGGNG